MALLGLAESSQDRAAVLGRVVGQWPAVDGGEEGAVLQGSLSNAVPAALAQHSLCPSAGALLSRVKPPLQVGLTPNTAELLLTHAPWCRRSP